ncbi:hypothetical protein E4T50_09232 [Aureobasidium sp. EXF-12298]|nr:hypothetical protein E4T50_09232 [Aureobasidium sp. EXF-12298]
MSTNGDLEMADANAGAEINDAEVELVEPQRIRVPTDEVNVYDVLEKGLSDLMDLCDVVVDKFTVSRDEFNASKA